MTMVAELIEILDLYGDRRLADMYIDSRRADLNSAGEKWYTNHGYIKIWIPK